MRKFVPIALGAALAVSGCMPTGGIGTLFGRGDDAPPVVQAGPETPRPEARPEGVPGAPLSVLSDAAVPQAAAPVAGALLGREQATLGAPTDPGLWLMTQHVTAPIPGRVVVPATGQAALMELRPSGGTGGRLSLAAMQALGLPLTALAEVEVYAGG